MLNEELEGETLDSEQKESLGVAKQCLEACYELEDDSPVDTPNLLTIFHKLNLPVPEEEVLKLEAEGEAFKLRGNEFMREGDFLAAVDYYSKAIKANNNKAIYYCNRAAAYSRLNRHREALLDCKDAIRLDPSYGKAYGRLGIAYSNLNMYQQAAEAYRSALQLDPTNASYEANLKLAEEKIPQSAAHPSLPAEFDFGGFMNNPALLNMASQMLNDPTFRNMVTGIMNPGPGGTTLESFVEVGQHIAEQMGNPHVLEDISNSMSSDDNGQGPRPNGENRD